MPANNQQPPPYILDESWEHLDPPSLMAEFDRRGEQLAYRYEFVDDPYLAGLDLDTTATIMRGCRRRRRPIWWPRPARMVTMLSPNAGRFDHRLGFTPDHMPAGR